MPPTFALHDLGWHAFQQLCHTVLREILGQTVESFLDVNDGGRDGAFAGRWSPRPTEVFEGDFVVQCKHTARPGYNLRLSDLSDEFAKARRLAYRGQCNVYLLMTNAGVSGTTSESICSELVRAGVQHSRVLSTSWLNQQIRETARLRRLVPRLYGLGDLTQILDERAYRQAAAVLDAMRVDLSKLVLTGTFAAGQKALHEHAFVLLLGAAATGKTTIAAQLALGAADADPDESSAAVVKLDTIADLQHRWNPDEPQLIWLDDAFGATQFEHALAGEWTRAIPRINAALHAGSQFVVTSRDYIFKAARPYLKPGAFPLLNEAQVVVDVSDLTADERRQILFNHLRHGRQPREFIVALQPHLEMAADHPGFSPELARRLAEPVFTTSMTWVSATKIDDFFARPAEFLRDVMEGLDNDARAALGLVFLNRNWVPSPIELDHDEQDMVARFGSSLGGVLRALSSLDGSLVRQVVHETQSGWEFAHPTMVEAFADLLQTPDLFHHFLAAFPVGTLLSQVTCGDIGWNRATVVPPVHYPVVLERLDEPLPDAFERRWRARDRRMSFLATRCDASFLTAWLDRHPDFLAPPVDIGLPVEADASNELIARLHELDLLPEAIREQCARQLIDYCVSGEDTAALLSDRSRSLLTDEDRELLDQRVHLELLPDLPAAISRLTDGVYPSPKDEDEAEQLITPLRELADQLPNIYPDSDPIEGIAAELGDMLDGWVANHSADENAEAEESPQPAPEPPAKAPTGERSVFDDLVEGRE